MAMVSLRLISLTISLSGNESTCIDCQKLPAKGAKCDRHQHNTVTGMGVNMCQWANLHVLWFVCGKIFIAGSFMFWTNTLCWCINGLNDTQVLREMMRPFSMVCKFSWHHHHHESPENEGGQTEQVVAAAAQSDLTDDNKGGVERTVSFLLTESPRRRRLLPILRKNCSQNSESPC